LSPQPPTILSKGLDVTEVEVSEDVTISEEMAEKIEDVASRYALSFDEAVIYLVQLGLDWIEEKRAGL
jgi:hypothetical protein